MPRAPTELLTLLARHHGIAAAPIPAVRQPDAQFDVGDADRLVTLTAADVQARLEARLADDPSDPAPALRAELRAFAGFDAAGCVFAVGVPAARAAAVAAARAETGRPHALVVGARPAGLDGGFDVFGFDGLAAARSAIDAHRSDLAVLLLEPRGDADVLRDVVACARAAGARIVVDESRTAGRLADTTVTAALGLAADEVLVGPSLAASLPFAARIGPRVATTAPAAPQPDAVALEVALAGVGLLREMPVATTLAAWGERLRQRFSTRCRAEDIVAELAGPAAFPHTRFAGQENADAPLIAHHFQLELRALGVAAEADVALPIDLEATTLDAVVAAYEGAISRIRTLLVEHNSYLSGGVPYVFRGGDPRLRARGIAKYRYPKLGGVTVEPVDGERMRIAFDAGRLGPITSSGFYLPTRIRGDFDITVNYTVRTWLPGPDSACLGLFVQNEPSTARYYAQLMSTSNRPGEISAAAGLAGTLSGRRAVPGARGALRLARRGARVVAFHRDESDADWQELGALEPCATDDVIVGAKIWSKIECGGLVVDLADLVVDAEVPVDQFPELEPRPDPRTR